MDTVEISVLVAGIVLIGAVLWYFFGPREATTASVGRDHVQTVRIVVKGGYTPDVITVRQGVPVRLEFFRDETSSCSDQVVLPDFGIARDLPAHQTTTVEFTPARIGEFVFTCGMRMMRGAIRVRA